MVPARTLIVGAGAITAVGNCVPQIWASVRTGLSRYSQPGPVDRDGEPIRMALVSEAELEPLRIESEPTGLSCRQRRMVRLGAPALREASEGLALAEPPPLFLALPRPETKKAPSPAPMLAALAEQAGVSFDEQASQCFPVGRAGFFLALEQGIRVLATGRVSTVLVGGVDTHADLRGLATLDAERRLLGERVSDGFVPGEGAGFLVLARSTTQSRGPSTWIAGVGVAQDPGHRHAQEPARGEGLWNALNGMFASSPLGEARIASTFAGLNGESLGAKEWGVAKIRHRECFADGDTLDHPADCYGDIGAATGAVLVALAHTALMKQQRRGPILVWASSDHEERGCALVDRDIT